MKNEKLMYCIFNKFIIKRRTNMEILVILWQLIAMVQGFFSYGTAYRLTKNGGDNGVSLFGWFFALQLASWIPGLGMYLWYKYRYI